MPNCRYCNKFLKEVAKRAKIEKPIIQNPKNTTKCFYLDTD